ncbi:MAG: hypothetical protein ACK4MF_01650 [Hyphomicrobiaceae bacterium]
MRLNVFSAVLAAAVASLFAVGSANAASCSSWKATCESRGGGASCDAKYAKCLKTGTFTEGAKFGGATHTGLAKT